MQHIYSYIIYIHVSKVNFPKPTSQFLLLRENLHLPRFPVKKTARQKQLTLILLKEAGKTTTSLHTQHFLAPKYLTSQNASGDSELCSRGGR